MPRRRAGWAIVGRTEEGKRAPSAARRASNWQPAAIQARSVKAQKAAEADSFGAVAREWFGKHAPRWVPRHAEKILRRLERDVFPQIGTRPVSKVTAPELLSACGLTRLDGDGDGIPCEALC